MKFQPFSNAKRVPVFVGGLLRSAAGARGAGLGMLREGTE